ncbi:hypothetical protein BJV74DRAFT_797688 [Russula compacta]|nr:hypothetical protein BJV74DRAFT_797688 [Russula compacta]
MAIAVIRMQCGYLTFADRGDNPGPERTIVTSNHIALPVNPISCLSVPGWFIPTAQLIWEFVTTLDYEWSVIRGHRPYRWSIWIYSVARATTLFAVILGIITLNLTSPHNCQTSGYVAIAASSLLIVLRIKRVIVVIALVTWGANLVNVIYGGYSISSLLDLWGLSRPQLHSRWVPDLDTCSIAKSHGRLEPIFIFTLVTDIVLLSIMLLGLFRMRSHGSGSFTLSHLLWKQGLIWLLLATLAVMFELPAPLILSIAGTRMHRALVDRASRPVEIQMEVAINTVREQHATPRTSCESSRIDINMDGQRPSTPYELGLEDDLES